MAIKLPTGYRFLDVGEIIKGTDLYNSNGYGKWRDVTEGTPDNIGNPRENYHVEFCRVAISPKGNFVTNGL
jgi:hypothetical protein